MGETSAGGHVVRVGYAACYPRRIPPAGMPAPATVRDRVLPCWSRRRPATGAVAARPGPRPGHSRLDGPADGEIDENLGATCPSARSTASGRRLSASRIAVEVKLALPWTV